MTKTIPHILPVVCTLMLASCEMPENSSAVDHNSATQTGPSCSLESLPTFPDVGFTSATAETRPVPHCKMVGVIGAEINFELLLPDDWNGKFVMGGGGGFVGSVVNAAQDFWGALQMGYATVGTDTGHQGPGTRDIP